MPLRLQLRSLLLASPLARKRRGRNRGTIYLLPVVAVGLLFLPQVGSVFHGLRRHYPGGPLAPLTFPLQAHRSRAVAPPCRVNSLLAVLVSGLGGLGLLRFLRLKRLVHHPAHDAAALGAALRRKRRRLGQRRRGGRSEGLARQETEPREVG